MLKDMKTQTHLKPGQKRTKRLVEQFGDALLCVRYRYDVNRGIRLKTVEIVVEEKAWQPASRLRDEDVIFLMAPPRQLHARYATRQKDNSDGFISSSKSGKNYFLCAPVFSEFSFRRHRINNCL